MAAAPTAAAPLHRPRVSPLARRLAAQEGVDLAGLTGTGADGSIRADDVRRAGRHTPTTVTTTPTAPPARRAPTTRPATDMRHSIAALMTQSNREIPHYHLTHTIDLRRGLLWLGAQP